MMTLEQIERLRFTVESQLLGVGPDDLSRQILIALDELAAMKGLSVLADSGIDMAPIKRAAGQQLAKFPDIGEFIDRLLSAGWRDKADAQWEGVTKFHAELAAAFGQRHDVSLIGEGDKAEAVEPAAASGLCGRCHGTGFIAVARHLTDACPDCNGEAYIPVSDQTMKVWIVYRKGYEWCETVGVWANKQEADADAADRNKKTAMAKTSKERLSVYTVKAHKVRGVSDEGAN